MSFPNIQKLTMQILGQMRRPHCVDRGAFGACARTRDEQRKMHRHAHDARLWAGKPRACVKSPRRKIRMDFSPISGELTVKQVGKGRFLNLQVN
jgi:hypothetical protein